MHKGPALPERFARHVTDKAGSTGAFVLACSVIVAWLATGPAFAFSDTWQLVINTGTTIITFLMVFLIQRSQNKDALAMHAKLNELIAAMHGASNRLLNVEELSEDEIHMLHDYYRSLAMLAKRDHDITASHTVEEAELLHAAKLAHRREMRHPHKVQ